MLPQFLVAGAARCGTTSLYYYLNQHPEIDLPRKETFFFARKFYESAPPGGPPLYRDKNQLVLTERAYDRFFSRCRKKLTGEISTCYGYFHESSIPLIREKLGDVKILFLLRHPVHRAWSGYRHFVRLHYETLSFGDAIAGEQERIRENRDFMWYYVQLGFYARQVEAFKANFSSVKVVLSEDFFHAPQAVLKEIFRFIGADDHFVPDTGFRYNFSHENRQTMLYQVLNNPVSNLMIKPIVRKIVPSRQRIAWGLRLRSPSSSPAPLPDPEHFRQLSNLYREDVQILETRNGLDLTAWKVLDLQWQP